MANFNIPWNPRRIEHRIGRIHRIGQAHEVSIYSLASKGTTVEHILRILDAKVNLFQLVVGELDMILGPLDEKREFKDILMDIWLAARNEEELAQGADDLGDELLVVKTGTHGVMDQYQFEYQPDFPVKRCLLPHGVWTHGRAVCLPAPLT